MAEELGQDSLSREKPTWVLPNSESLSGSGDKKGLNPLFPSSNSATPTPASTPSTPLGQNRVGMSDGGGSSGGGGSDHDLHIWTERERRKKMKTMFACLHSLLPQLPPKTDKSTIIDEAASYIKTLQQTFQYLQKQKLEMIQRATTIDYDPSSPTSLSFKGRDAYVADQVSCRNLSSRTNMPHSFPIPSFPISFQTWSSPNFTLNVCGEDAQINVCTPKKPGLLTTILDVLEKHKLEVLTFQISSDHYRTMFMVHAHANLVSNRFQKATSPEERFKLAVTEMIFLISSL